MNDVQMNERLLHTHTHTLAYYREGYFYFGFFNTAQPQRLDGI